MIKFFNRIRRQLAAENKVMAYMRYAVGEIVLVVVGILIALQINNWNEERKKENEFRFSLKQLHQTISVDKALMTSLKDIYTFQIKMIDSLLSGAQNIPYNQLPRIIQSLDYYGIEELTRYSDQKFRESLVIYNPSGELQNELAEQLFKYLRDLNLTFGFDSNNKYRLLNTEPLLTRYLINQNIPLLTYVPGTRFSEFYSNDNYAQLTFSYTSKHLLTVRNLLNGEAFISSLKTIKERKNLGITACDLTEKTSDRLIYLIKKYDPDIKLFYKELRIIGDATPLHSWTEDIQMTPMDTGHMKWETEVELTEGDVKFRTDNNWTFNWGIGQNSSDRLVFNGPNIPVQSGHYKVYVDLNERTYKFISLED
jgi:hypothetical protein